ncbi:stalk domain-containing protein [Paenibacillus maysiensis]|uniref:stalk domain-containing protein n=1 Tax=Paenibacillus maysiensis TaxID=1155954 RepID=UPI00047219D9|nr:stalk domain-containing protein [Paenibacillus maysiensis]
MKKWSYILSGVLIGAVVATAGNAFADQIKSMVGQTVAGEYNVKVNGNSLTENAIVVDGKAHVPLRAVSDSLGAGVKVDGKTIQIDTQSSKESSVESKNTSQQESESIQIYTQNIEAMITSTKSDKSFWEGLLRDAEDSQVKYNKRIDELSNLPASNDPITQENRKKSLARAQEMIEENSKKIAEYKEKITKYDKDIAKLETRLTDSNK